MLNKITVTGSGGSDHLREASQWTLCPSSHVEVIEGEEEWAGISPYFILDEEKHNTQGGESFDIAAHVPWG